MEMNKHPIPISLAQSDPCDVLGPDMSIYLMNDQPTICPMSVHRTSWVGENPQLHNFICSSKFCVEEDDDFGVVEVDDKWTPETESL